MRQNLSHAFSNLLSLRLNWSEAYSLRFAPIESERERFSQRLHSLRRENVAAIEVAARMNEYRHDVFSSWRYSFITLRSDRVGAKRIHYASLRLYRSESVSRSDFDRCDVFTSQRRKSLREFDIATTQLRRGDIHIHCDVYTSSRRTSLRRDGKHRVAANTVAAMGNHRCDK